MIEERNNLTMPVNMETDMKRPTNSQNTHEQKMFWNTIEENAKRKGKYNHG